MSKVAETISQKEVEAAQTLVASLKIGDRVIVDDSRFATVARYCKGTPWPLGSPMDDVTRIFVRFDGHKRVTAVHGHRIRLLTGYRGDK